MLHPIEHAHIAVAQMNGCARHTLSDGVALVNPRLTLRSFNCVTGAAVATLPRLMAEAQALYAEYGRAPALALADYLDPALFAAVRAAGWQPQKPVQQFMEHAGTTTSLPDVEIARLTPALVPAFVRILTESFGWSTASRDQQLAHYADLVDRGVGWHVVALVNGVSVSTTSLFAASDERWGVYKVATLPGFRGHGLAAALVTQALHTAYAAGARSIFLYTPAGSNAAALYARLGFAPVFQRTLYAPPTA